MLHKTIEIIIYHFILIFGYIILEFILESLQVLFANKKAKNLVKKKEMMTIFINFQFISL